ncbi:MAG: tetratricopeptide repeat protein [Nitrospiraceae bacterium]
MKSGLLHTLSVVGVIFFSFTLETAPALAQSAAYHEAEKRGSTLFKEGRHAEALPFFEKAMALAEEELAPDHATIIVGLMNTAKVLVALGKDGRAKLLIARAEQIADTTDITGHLAVGRVFESLAYLYHSKSRHAEAEPLDSRALPILKKALGDTHPDVIEILHYLGLSNYWLENYRIAELYLELAVRFRKNAAEPDYAKLAASYNVQANVYKALSKYTLARKIHEFELAAKEKAFGPDHPRVALALHNVASMFLEEDQYEEAEPLFKRALAIQQKALPPDHPDTALVLTNTAALYWRQGRYTDAEPFQRRALAVYEAHRPPGHADIENAAERLARLADNLGRYTDAEVLHGRVAAIREKNHGPDHPAFAESLKYLAQAIHQQGRYQEAEARYRRALAIFEKALGPETAEAAGVLSNLAIVLSDQGRYDQAEEHHKQALSIERATLRPDHPHIGTTHHNLGTLYIRLGRYEEAEKALKRSLEITEKNDGPDHPMVANSLNSLAALYNDLGRYADAETLYKRSLLIKERTLGPDHPFVGDTLSNLARVYSAQDRMEEAGLLFERALKIDEKVRAPGDPQLSISLSNLGSHYSDLGLYEKAESLLKRALSVAEQTLGSDHPAVASSLYNLGGLYAQQKRWDDAIPYLQRVLAIREKAYGPDHPDVASALDRLAGLYTQKGRYSEVEPLLQRALSIYGKILEPNHPSLARIYAGLGNMRLGQERRTEALEAFRRASAIYRSRRSAPTSAGHAGKRGGKKSISQNAYYLHLHTALINYIYDPEHSPALAEEAFEYMQLVTEGDTAKAVARMAARFAAKDDALARTVRERQDAVNMWRATDKALIEAAAQSPEARDRNREESLRQRLADLDRAIAGLDATLSMEFPEYASLITPQPRSLGEVQALLGPDEALLSFFVAGDETLLWVLRKDRTNFFATDIKGTELAETVAALRYHLEDLGDLSFPVGQAYDLYETLFSQAETLLAGAKHLFIVPHGPLQQLPLGLLVTEKPDAPLAHDEALKDVPWLVKKVAMTTLPSISSLHALRLFAGNTRAGQAFKGIGNPVLKGAPGNMKGIRASLLFTRGGLADVRRVRQLASLPDTEDELKSIAQSLGAKPEDLYLRNRATETEIKKADLSDVRVVAFATHGLTAGDFEAVGEPSLVLTPPDTATEEDDGLLTAGEVAQLKLNADWVILSACNTAAPGGAPGAEGLSGLARAFFYAGARTLLVSHWPVASDAATRLTTRTFQIMADNPSLGRSEAFRRSMLELMNDKDRPYYAHPLFWAPFVVVGEGGTYRPTLQ